MQSEDAVVSIERRARVVEHRVTTRLTFARARDGVISMWTVRYWIEGDPEHGGVESWKEAHKLAVAASGRFDPLRPADELAKMFLDQVAAANSVEVCDQEGNGCAVHRDWP